MQMRMMRLHPAMNTIDLSTFLASAKRLSTGLLKRLLLKQLLSFENEHRKGVNEGVYFESVQRNPLELVEKLAYATFVEVFAVESVVNCVVVHDKY